MPRRDLTSIPTPSPFVDTVTSPLCMPLAELAPLHLSLTPLHPLPQSAAQEMPCIVSRDESLHASAGAPSPLPSLPPIESRGLLGSIRGCKTSGAPRNQIPCQRIVGEGKRGRGGADGGEEREGEGQREGEEAVSWDSLQSSVWFAL